MITAETLPPPIEDASAWRGTDMAKDTSWLVSLDEDTIAEI